MGRELRERTVHALVTAGGRLFDVAVARAALTFSKEVLRKTGSALAAARPGASGTRAVAPPALSFLANCLRYLQVEVRCSAAEALVCLGLSFAAGEAAGVAALGARIVRSPPALVA